MLRTTNRLVFASLASLMFVGCGGGGDEADLTGAGGAGQSDAASDTSTGGKAGSGGSAGSAGTAGAAGSAGTGGTAGMGGSAGTAGSAGADAGDDAAPVCTKGDFKCEGDVLQTCTEDGSQYLNVASCKAGLCDAAGKQCDNCVAKETKCLTDSRLQTCSDDGQMVSEADCPASAKFCAVSGGVASCIECTKTADCVVSTSECQMAACGTDGICGTVLVAKDTPCGAVGAGGKCDGAGACRYCSAGEVRCSSLTPETCDAEGQWIAGAACGGNEPLCLGGACVQCVSAGDCPASSNECVQPACDAVNACGYTPKATGTGCANGLGKCDGAGQCNVCTPGTAVCNGNVPLVCGANGQYAPQPACGGATPNCDAATGTCVQCTTATQCALGNECLTASCTANTCGYLPKPSGTACTGGTCSPLGTCQACTPGAVKCVGESVQTCNSSGQYDPVVACVAPKPYCDDATTSCVECETAGQCPAATNECLVATCTGSACGFAPKPADTNCAGGTGKCNGAGQCNVCTPGTRICNGNVPLLCESNGQYAPQAACSGATANCDPATGTCVQCTVASQCPASCNPCLDAVCNSNTCGFAPKQLGAACPGGTCSGSGVCWACTPSTEVCSGNGVLTCNVNGQYDPIANCVAPKPYCEPGSVECVECMTAGQCTTPVNPCLQATCAGNVCGIGNKADGTSCAVASDTGTCSAGNCRVCTTGAKRCKTGVTNVAQTCDANGQWGDSATCSGATPVCVAGACVSDQACADGTVELGEAEWKRTDIAYCATGKLDVPATAVAACGPGWHVCTAAEFTSRNDFRVLPAGSTGFSATLDDGVNCRVVDNGTATGHNATSDAVRAGYAGSCTGTLSNSTWGRQVMSPWQGGCDWGSSCGVMCCSSPPAPTWKLMGTKSAQVMFGSCGQTETKTITCTTGNLGSEVRIYNNNEVELKPGTEDTGAYQGMSATVNGATMSLTGRTGCGGDNLQTQTVTYYVCGY
ncbi:MAG TPA: hypothetical protein PLI95_13795 [Polyangiaceae bacterium]|nr:hypothetical protein [Polyangiaceae bacterium]